MSTEQSADRPPLLQRLYDRIWLLAALAIAFWLVSYVAWGLTDIFAVG